MKFQGALIKEQGIEFAIVVVKPHAINNSIEADKTRNSFRSCFPSVPIILMAQNSKGIPTFQGRTDIVKFLSKISISRIPWKSYSTN